MIRWFQSGQYFKERIPPKGFYVPSETRSSHKQYIFWVAVFSRLSVVLSAKLNKLTISIPITQLYLWLQFLFIKWLIWIRVHDFDIEIVFCCVNSNNFTSKTLLSDTSRCIDSWDRLWCIFILPLYSKATLLIRRCRSQSSRRRHHHQKWLLQTNLQKTHIW